jgi:hypothetical protein
MMRTTSPCVFIISFASNIYIHIQSDGMKMKGKGTAVAAAAARSDSNYTQRTTLKGKGKGKEWRRNGKPTETWETLSERVSTRLSVQILSCAFICCSTFPVGSSNRPTNQLTKRTVYNLQCTYKHTYKEVRIPNSRL